MTATTVSRATDPALWPDRDGDSGGNVRSQIVQAAMQAPSVHNTQPWLFTSCSEGLDLHGDQSRQLSVLDPEGRQLHLSCGAALLNAQVAARGFGLTARTQLLPDRQDPTHLARIRLTAAAAMTRPEQGLVDAIELRHTYRDAFAPRPLAGMVLDRLRAAAEAQGAYLYVLSDPDALLVLQCVLDRADRTQNHDPAYGRELRAWVHTGPADDGIPTCALPVDAQRGSSLRLREFAPAAELDVPHPSHPDLEGRGSADPPVAERPDVVVIVCADDTPQSWLVAGLAMEAVMLQAAREGVMGQPLSQATDLPGSRPRLRAALGLVGIPQLALRLGYATGVAATPRRAVTDVLDHQAGTAPATASQALHDKALRDKRLGVWESEGGRLAKPGI